METEPKPKFNYIGVCETHDFKTEGVNGCTVVNNLNDHVSAHIHDEIPCNGIEIQVYIDGKLVEPVASP